LGDRGRILRRSWRHSGRGYGGVGWVKRELIGASSNWNGEGNYSPGTEDNLALTPYPCMAPLPFFNILRENF